MFVNKRAFLICIVLSLLTDWKQRESGFSEDFMQWFSTCCEIWLD